MSEVLVLGGGAWGTALANLLAENTNKPVYLWSYEKEVANTINSKLINKKYLPSKKINKKIKILGVTVLTSFSDSSIKKIGYTKSIKEIVIRQAKLSKMAGLDGIVCSGHEAKFVKKICPNMEIVTPGIRLMGDNKGDQKRVMTPKKAFQNGATSIVIGRSVTQGNIKNNIQKLIKSLN